MRVSRKTNTSLAEELYEYTGGEYMEPSPEFLDTVSQISRLIERPEVYPVYNDGKTIPQVGECVLINEKAGQSFSHEHGGRYHNECCRRYFGEVAEIHPHVIVFKTDRGMVSERILDFKVGIIKYAKLKRIPDRPENISYDQKLLGSFINSFENLLDEW